MPFCEYKRCRRVAYKPLGKIAVGEITGIKDGFGNSWAQTVYVCDKHFKKIVGGILGYKPESQSRRRS